MRDTASTRRTTRLKRLRTIEAQRKTRRTASPPEPEVPEFERRPLYTGGSIQGPVFDKGKWRRHPTPDPIGYVDGFGEKTGLAWSWGDQCPKCSSPTEFGWCTKCAWVCDNKDRPAPEPIAFTRGGEWVYVR